MALRINPILLGGAPAHLVLSAQIGALLGSDLVGYYTADDAIVDGSGNALVWPGRVGNPLTPQLAGNYRTLTTVSGRAALTCSSGAGTYYDAAGAAVSVAEAIMVAQVPSLPVSDETGGARNSGSAYVQISAPSTWNYASTAQENCIKTAGPSAGFKVINGYRTAASGYLSIGGIGTSTTRGWYAPIACVIYCSRQLTPVERAKLTCALSDYYGISVSADVRKVATMPVAGATVIAPLLTSFQSYGSVNSALTIAGAPTIGASGATFDGVDDAVSLVADSGYDFTFVTRAKYNAIVGNKVLYNAHQGGSVGGWVTRVGGAAYNFVASGVADLGAWGTVDLSYHTHTCIRSGSNVYFYIDGVLRGSGAVGTNGANLILGARYYSALVDFASCTHQHSSQFPSALNATDQAAVEAWAEAA